MKSPTVRIRRAVGRGRTGSARTWNASGPVMRTPWRLAKSAMIAGSRTIRSNHDGIARGARVTSSARSFREDMLWLAGLFEGEGYFGMSSQHAVKLSLGMTDRDVVEQAHQLMRASGKIRTALPAFSRRLKAIYSFEISGPAAVGWMVMLYGFLGQRRREKIRDVRRARRRRRVAARYRQQCRYGHPLRRRPRGLQAQRLCLECERRRPRHRFGRARGAANQLMLIG